MPDATRLFKGQPKEFVRSWAFFFNIVVRIPSPCLIANTLSTQLVPRVSIPDVRRFIQIVLILCLLGAAGITWYLYKKGFTKPWRDWLVSELRTRGIEASFSKLTVEPFRGVVAKDVKLYDSASKRRLIAKIDEVVVDANYAHAVRGEPFLDALTLVDASIQLPLDPKDPNGPSLKIDRLNTRLHLPPKQLLVARLEADVLGIRVKATGQFANPATAAPTSKPGPPAKDQPSALLRIVEQLQELHFEGRPPVLDIRFSGDLAKPDTLRVDANLSAEKIRRKGYQLDSLQVTGTWQNSALVIKQFDARDHVGILQAFASCRSSTGAVDLRIRSGLDLPRMLRSFGFEIGDLDFHSVPELDLTVRGTLPAPARPPGFSIIGQVRVGPFHYGNVPLDRLSADFSWDGHRWAVRDLYARHATGGELRADVQQDYRPNGEGDFRLALQSSLNPEVLTPYFRAQSSVESQLTADRLDMFHFYEPPTVSLSARGPSYLDCSASGELSFGRVSYRGTLAAKGHANLRYNGRVLNVDNYVIHRDEGIGGGEIAFDLENKLVYLKNVRSTLHPADVAAWIDPDLVHDLQPYRFGKKPPNLLINGTVDQLNPPKRNHLTVSVDAPAMEYKFCGKVLDFTNVTADLLFTYERLKLSDVRAELFGGTVKGDGDISVLKARPGHSATLRFGDIDFSKLTKLYFDYDESKGKLNGTYSFNGEGDDGRSMRGEGELNVTDGNVFAIPFLGPFSEILSKIVPGMGFNKAHKASATFAVADGVITTRNLVVAGRGFSMMGDGRIWFLDDHMDFDMRVNAQGLPGVILYPVSKFFEYRANSKFSKPVWRQKVIPRFGGGDKR